MKALWAKREIDPLSLYTVQDVGKKFRAYSIRQAMTPEWFEAPYYNTFFASRGIIDIFFATFPVNQDAVSTFAIHAGNQRGPFSLAEIELAARVLRGIKWFHRNLMLAHGQLVASAPLSPAERKVLQELLTDASEKEIAQHLNLAVSTVHQYVGSLYRKFGVKGRAGLMSLWLNAAR